MVLPIPQSGDYVTPELFAALTPRSVYLTSATTAPSTTYVDTPLLIVGLAGEVWDLDFKLFHKMSSTGDLAIRFTFPNGQISWGGLIPVTTIAATGTSSASNEYRSRQAETSSPSTALQVGSMSDGNGVFTRLGLTWTCTGGGTLRLQIATASAAGSISLLPDSSVIGRRMA